MPAQSLQLLEEGPYDGSHGPQQQREKAQYQAAYWNFVLQNFADFQLIATNTNALYPFRLVASDIRVVITGELPTSQVDAAVQGNPDGFWLRLKHYQPLREYLKAAIPKCVALHAKKREKKERAAFLRVQRLKAMRAENARAEKRRRMDDSADEDDDSEPQPAKKQGQRTVRDWADEDYNPRKKSRVL